MKLDDIEKAAKDCADMLCGPEFRKPILDRFQLTLEPEFVVKLIALVRVQHTAIKTMRDAVTDGDRAIPADYESSIEGADGALKQYEDFEGGEHGR